MIFTGSRLPGIPKPIYNESLASWVQRVCQVYDLTFDRFHKTFSTSGGPDADLCLTADQLSGLAALAGLSPSETGIFRGCFCRLATIPELQKLLLHPLRDGYSYRFCPDCWATDKIPYLRVEWRFRHCEHCFIHKTRLRARCHSCKRPLAMHRSVLGGTTTPPPVPHLAVCLHCRADLRSRTGASLSGSTEGSFEQIELQRAIISSVLHGYFRIAPFSEKRDVAELLFIMEHVGLEAADEKSLAVLRQFDERDQSVLREILRTALGGARWLRPGHPRRKRIARELYGLWSQGSDDDC